MNTESVHFLRSRARHKLRGFRSEERFASIHGSPRADTYKSNSPSPFGPIVILTFLVLLIGTRLTYQQQNLCPKMCTCDERNLETTCKDRTRASGIPHTLHPDTKKLTINHAQTTQFIGSDYLTKLEILDLAYNKITMVDFHEISKNVDLISLNTSHNSIIELKDSSGAQTISDLGLSSSKSFDTAILTDPKIIKNMIRINVLEFILSYNNLSTLKNFIFIRWHKLQRLDLSFNSIRTLESQSLLGLAKLEYINLRGNQLTQVPTLALQSTASSLLSTSYPPSSVIASSLRNLDLSENKLSFIGPDSFVLLEKLQELHLDSCSVNLIHEQAFKGLHTLHLLSLNSNHLQEVPSLSFIYLSQLRSLRLNANRITHLQPHSFNGLTNLEELQLNNGSFARLPSGVFDRLSELRRLEITHNTNLTRVDDGTFENLPKLTYLSLFSDNLKSLPNSFSGEPSALYVMDLRGNPLHCGCELKWLTQWLKKFNQTSKSLQDALNLGTHRHEAKHQIDDIQPILMDLQLTEELQGLNCFEPPALKGKLIVELPENKLECLKPSSDVNVHIGFASLFFITLIMTFACLISCCRNKRHLFVILKENLVRNQISIVLPYSRNLDKTADDFKKETQLYGYNYEPAEYFPSTRMYSANGARDEFPEIQTYSQHI